MINRDRSFEVLIQEHHRRAFAYALGIAPSKEVAEDLVQEAFLIAHRKMDQFDPTKNFGAWIRGIVRKRFLQWCERTREYPIDPTTISEVARFHAELDNSHGDPNEALDALGGCVEELPNDMGRTVDLFYFKRMPGAQVAEELNASEITIRKRLQRAREKLADCIRMKLQTGTV